MDGRRKESLLASSGRVRGRLYVQWRAALAGRIDITDNILIAASLLPSLPPGHSNTRSANCPPGQPRPKISLLFGSKNLLRPLLVSSPAFVFGVEGAGQAGYRGQGGRTQHTEH